MMKYTNHNKQISIKIKNFTLATQETLSFPDSLLSLSPRPLIFYKYISNCYDQMIQNNCYNNKHNTKR
eukprot:UN10875